MQGGPLLVISKVSKVITPLIGVINHSCPFIFGHVLRLYRYNSIYNW